MTLLSAAAWPSNAELIAEVAQLYFKDGDRIYDATLEQGIWWKNRAEWGVTVVAHVNKNDHDFRHTPYHDDTFDVIFYDPPYCAKGGRETSGIRTMDERYGQFDCPATPSLLQELIDDGLEEMTRIVKPKGLILVKCMNYISSGKLWPGALLTWEWAKDLGLTTEAVYTHLSTGNGGPQPAGRRQVHARNNSSTLYVFKK